MGLRAGTRSATLIAEGDEDVDILKAWEQDPFRIYDFTGPQKTIKEVTAVDSAFSRNPPYAVVDTGHGTDLIRCDGEEFAGAFTRPGAAWEANPGAYQTFRNPTEISAWMRYRNRQNATATQYIGLGLGWPDNSITYPFVTPFEAICAQVRLRTSDLTWELVFGSALSGVTTVVELEGVDTPASGIGQVVRLVWNPDQPSLRAYINGTLGAEIEGAANLSEDLPGEPNSNTGPNWFVTSGSHASGYLTLDIGPWFVRTFGVKDES